MDFSKDVLDRQSLPQKVLHEARFKILKVLELCDMLCPSISAYLWDEITIVDRARKVLDKLSPYGECCVLSAEF